MVRGVCGRNLPPIGIFTGNGHGGLGLDNVLVPVTDKVVVDEFRIIEFAGFSGHTPVARDPMTLLLSIAQARLPGLAVASPFRSNLAEHIVAPWAF